MTTVFSKSITRSLTILFNVAAMIVIVAEAAVAEGLPFIELGWVAAIVAAANILLRLKTKLPVTLTGGEPVAVEDNRP